MPLPQSPEPAAVTSSPTLDPLSVLAEQVAEINVVCAAAGQRPAEVMTRLAEYGGAGFTRGC